MNFSQTVGFTSVIRHSASSLAEGSPASYRILMDQYTGFVVGSNYVKTNYSDRAGNVRWVMW